MKSQAIDFDLHLTQKTDCGDVWLRLMPERAVFHAESGTLLVADLHLGKAAVFRARGLAVPQGTTSATLARLSQALERTQAQRLVILGDLLHAKESHAAPTLDALRRWRLRHQNLDCWAVQGNHDQHAGVLPEEFGFQTVEEFRHADWRGVHDAAKTAPSPQWLLSGHIHPVFELRSRVDALRLPCFWLDQHVLTLPAFGEFTGGYAVAAGQTFAPAQRFFIASQSVVEVDSRKPILKANK